jgi:hypothetical protein
VVKYLGTKCGDIYLGTIISLHLFNIKQQRRTEGKHNGNLFNSNAGQVSRESGSCLIETITLTSGTRADKLINQMTVKLQSPDETNAELATRDRLLLNSQSNPVLLNVFRSPINRQVRAENNGIRFVNFSVSFLSWSDQCFFSFLIPLSVPNLITIFISFLSNSSRILLIRKCERVTISN